MMAVDRALASQSDRRRSLQFKLAQFVLLVVGLIGTTSSSLPQSITATLVGIINDDQGLPVAGADVAATNQETNQIRTVPTSREGAFTLTHLPPGLYRVTVTAPGFRVFHETAVPLETGEVRRMAVLLQVASVHTEVTVVAPLRRLDTDTPSRGDLVPARLLEALPLNGRNYGDLAVLVPGIYHRVGEDEQGDGLSASGARADSAGFTLDGVVNRSDRNARAGVAVSLDAIREFDVRTSTYDAESGRTGGAQVAVVSKSGTNRLAGSFFDYLRHDALDARNVFAPPGESFPLRRQQWGGSVGGPMRRDRAFFFAAYERLRERRSLAAATTAPSAAWLRGDFRNLRGAGPDGIWGNADDTNRLVDPFTRKEFPTPNVIPDSMIDPVARRILPFIPAANLSDALDAYTAVGHTRDDRHLITGRFDTFWRSGASLSARWSGERDRGFDPFPSLRTFYPGFGRQSSGSLDSIAVIATAPIGGGWLNEARVGYFGHTQDTAGQNHATDFVSQLGIPGLNTDPSLWGFPSIRIDGFADFGDRPNDPSSFNVRNFQWADMITRARGRHTLKAGVDIVRSNYRETDLRNIRGDFRFRGRNTNPGNGTSSGFRAFADFLIGLPDQTGRQVGAEPARLQGWQTGFFIQEDWRAAKALTLSLGLRYDRQTPLDEASNRFANFVPEIGQVVLAGDPRFPTALVRTDNDNVAPRIGFAFRPFSGSSTVIRGGAGVYYSMEAFNVTRQQLGVSYPFVQREQYSRQGNNPRSLTFANPFPAERVSVQGVDQPLGMAVNYEAPVYYQYNLTVDRELGRDLAIEVGYVGSLGRHLGRRYNLNQPIAVDLQPDGTLVTIRPFPAFADIQFQDQTIHSSCNALQASARRRMSGGLTFLAAYTFSRTIDTGSVSTGNLTNVSTSGSQKSPQNIYDMRAERGLSDLHRSHQFSTAFRWALPIGSGRRFLAEAPSMTDRLVRNWEISGIVTLLSGRPFTPQYAAGDFATQRPDLVSSPYADVPAGLWFNPDAFARPMATPARPSLDGNAGRNILAGPAFKNLDLALMRTFRLHERAALQLRAEAFNLLNHPNYQLPVFLLDQSNVGRVTATANNAREWQLAARLMF